MQIVFSDLDGTLLASDKTLAPRTCDALDALAEHGIEFVPCSGRPFSGIKQNLIDLAATHYVVASNGALVCKVLDDNTCEVIHRTEMPREPLLWLYEQLKDLDILFDVLADGNSYSERFRFDRIDTFALDPLLLPDFKAMRTPYDATVPELVPTLKHLERLTIYWKHREDRDKIIELVQQRPELSWVSSLPTNLEISHKDASKGAALTWLCNQLDISVSEAVAFGDGLNDISMLEVAGVGVAMANAEPQVIEVADCTTTTNDECGVARYLEEQLNLA